MKRQHAIDSIYYYILRKIMKNSMQLLMVQTSLPHRQQQNKNSRESFLVNIMNKKGIIIQPNHTKWARIKQVLMTQIVQTKIECLRLVFIAGDSILQHVHGWEFSNAEQRVSVKSFSGSRAEDMKDYLKPLIRKKPYTIILHVGTNDIKDDKKTAEVVAAGILNLGTQIKDNSPHIKVCISGITIRKDKAAILNKIKNVNNVLTHLHR